MNAPTPVPTRSVESDAQSLMAQCRGRRWNLLQHYARLEIALKHRLENPPMTFGAKVRAWIKIDPAAKCFERLINARNLAAHALVSPVRIDGTPYAQWEVADGVSELNCAKFDKSALKVWADDLDALLKQAITAATA